MVSFLGPLLMGAAKGGLSSAFGSSSVSAGGLKLGGKRRRRRARGLTQAQKNDLLFVKNSVGKTAAAEYLALIGRR